MDINLKPCPFCGSNALVMQLKQSVSQRFYVVCANKRSGCIASEKYIFGKFYPTKSEAAFEWNRRANDEPIHD